MAARNPVDGTNWLLLAEAHEAAGAYHAAIDAWEQVRALGAELPADACYRMACCHARAGEPELALTRLQQAFTYGYRYLAHAQTDPALKFALHHPHFRDLVALIDPTTLSRDAGWRQDLTLFARQVKRTGYAPFRYIAELEFDTAVDVLRTAIPHLTDLQIATELMNSRAWSAMGIPGCWAWTTSRRCCRRCHCSAISSTRACSLSRRTLPTRTCSVPRWCAWGRARRDCVGRP